MAALHSRCGHNIFALWFLSCFFYSSPNLSSHRLDVYHTSTRGVAALSANLECMSEMWCMRLNGNTESKNDAKKSPSAHHCITMSGYNFATKARIDNRKTLVKQQYPPTSCQYGELQLTNGWGLLASLQHPSRYQRVSHLGFVTAATLLKLNGSQPNFARCLATSWAGTVHYIYIFSGSCPITEFCQVQNSLSVQVLRSILAALLHGTRVMGVSQTLRL